jgi:hypothetical protein
MKSERKSPSQGKKGWVAIFFLMFEMGEELSRTLPLSFF